jgi:hypothetical protein
MYLPYEIFRRFNHQNREPNPKLSSAQRKKKYAGENGKKHY